MSRATPRSRGAPPRELDEAAMTGDVDDDDGGDQYLLFAVPSSRYCPSPAAARWTSAGGGPGKTRVWQCIGNGAAAGGRGTVAPPPVNGSDGLGDVHETRRTSGRVRVDTRLTSTGDSPSSSLGSPSSPPRGHVLSPTSRRSGIPVRVTGTGTSYHATHHTMLDAACCPRITMY